MKFTKTICLAISVLFLAAVLSDGYSQTSDVQNQANTIILSAVGAGVVIGVVVSIFIGRAIKNKTETTKTLNDIYQAAEDSYLAKDYSTAIEKYREYVAIYDKKHAKGIGSPLLDRQYNFSKEKVDKLGGPKTGTNQ